MKKTRAKKFKVRMFYYLQNLFWGGGVCPGGFWLGGSLSGVYVWGFLSGVFCPDTLNNTDTNITTQDELEELAVTLCDKLMKAVDTSTPKPYSRNDPKSPSSQATLDLIKEKCRLRRLYNSTQDPNLPLTSCRRKLGPK